jgi:hypothetical protein
MAVATAKNHSATDEERIRPLANYPGEWIWKPDSENLHRVPPTFQLRPSLLPATATPFNMFGHDAMLARGKTLPDLITLAWSQKNSTMKVVLLTNLPPNRFDFIVTFEPNWPDKLIAEINKRFNLTQQVRGSDEGDEVLIQSASAAMSPNPTPLYPEAIDPNIGLPAAGFPQHQWSPPNPVLAPAAIRVQVHIQHVVGFMVQFTAQVPEGYQLKAAANDSSAPIFSSDSRGNYNCSWSPPFHAGRHLLALKDLTWDLPQVQPATPADASMEAVEQAAIARERESALAAAGLLLPPAPVTNCVARFPPRMRLPGQPEFAPFEVVLGQPKLLFSITNWPGDVFQAFLELTGPTNPSTPPN